MVDTSFNQEYKRSNCEIFYRPQILWNLPFQCQLSHDAFVLLDSILFHKTIPIITEFDSTLKNKNYLIIYFSNENDSISYDRYITFDSNYDNIFEFVYYLEKIEKTLQKDECIEWIFYYLDSSHYINLGGNGEFFKEEYVLWKIKNNKQ